MSRPYELDFSTCTMDDAIERAMILHPSVLLDSLRAQLADHVAYAPKANQSAQRGVKASIDACQIAIGALDGQLWREQIREALKLLTFGARIVAFNAACKSQLVPAHVRTAIAVRDVNGNRVGHYEFTQKLEG